MAAPHAPPSDAPLRTRPDERRAAFCGRPRCSRQLLSAQPAAQEPTRKNADANTPLHWACLNGHLEARPVYTALCPAAHPAAAAAARPPACPPPVFAAQVAKALLQAGASASALNAASRTPVDEAMAGNHQARARRASRRRREGAAQPAGRRGAQAVLDAIYELCAATDGGGGGGEDDEVFADEAEEEAGGGGEDDMVVAGDAAQPQDRQT